MRTVVDLLVSLFFFFFMDRTRVVDLVSRYRLRTFLSIFEIKLTRIYVIIEEILRKKRKRKVEASRFIESFIIEEIFYIA